MELNISEQLKEFLHSGLLGIFLGMFYDILGIIKCYLNNKKLVNLIFDALFWAVAIIALFTFVLIWTKGEMRWYILLGNFFGIFIYKNTISPLFFRGIRIIISIVIRFLHFISKPIYIAVGAIGRKLRKGSEKSGKKEKEETQE